MQIFLKTLLASSIILLSAQESVAEPFPNFNVEPPLWVTNPTPIAWGDCVPVPVVPIPFPQNNMAMGAIPAPQPMIQPFSFPAPMAEQPLPMPTPNITQMPNVASEVVCDDSSTQELLSLQAKYNKAASLSKAKIGELSQALSDTNNQMADARIIIETLSKEQESERAIAETQAKKMTALGQTTTEFTALKGAYKIRNDENVVLEKKLAELDSAHKSLKTKLGTLESSAGAQVRKLTALGQSSIELGALKGAYKLRNDENIELKKKLAELDGANKSLKTKLGTVETNVGSQARKLTVLSQVSTELTALKSAYKAKNDANAILKIEKNSLDTKLNSLKTARALKGAQDNDIINALKKKLANFDGANKTLKTQLSSAEMNAGSQARKLTALGQSTLELKALQSAYKARNDENVDLKKKLAELDGVHKSLKTKLGAVETNVGAQARKLTALGQASTELAALKSAYKAKNDENSALKKEKGMLSTKLNSLETARALKGAQDSNIIDGLNKKLASLDDSNKTLKTQLSSAEIGAGAQARKLTALSQSAIEFKALQSAYKMRNNENVTLKNQLDQLKRQLKEATANCKLEVAELNKQLSFSSEQNSALSAKITTITGELNALKSAYSNLGKEKSTLASQLTVATADKDKDGVLDKSDKCPYTLEGVEVDSIGCLADADNDGVTDSKDACPTSAIGTHVDERGCPKIVDADGDTVADADDLCPKTVAGTKVNEFGCGLTENITLKGVNFSTGSAKLTPNSLPVIDAAAKTLNQNPNLNIEIAGYTDNKGIAVLNKNLSQRRANTVMIQLIRKNVDPKRLIAKGYGEKDPVVSNDTEEGRATNRRVELKIRQ